MDGSGELREKRGRWLATSMRLTHLFIHSAATFTCKYSSFSEHCCGHVVQDCCTSLQTAACLLIVAQVRLVSVHTHTTDCISSSYRSCVVFYQQWFAGWRDVSKRGSAPAKPRFLGLPPALHLSRKCAAPLIREGGTRARERERRQASKQARKRA